MGYDDDSWDSTIEADARGAIAETKPATDWSMRQDTHNLRMIALTFPLKYFLELAIKEIERLRAENGEITHAE